jgi:hypothetical protein
MTALVNDLMGGAGAPSALATLLGEEIVAVTASGTVQLSRAAAISAGNALGMGFNIVSTSAGNVAVQLLDTFPVGRSTFVDVVTATSANVFPPAGCTIQGGTTNAPLVAEQNYPIQIFRTSRTAFIAIRSAGVTSSPITAGTGLAGTTTFTVDQTPAVIAAAGSSQGDATPITALINVVTTVGVGTGVVLPASSRLFNRRIVNHGANTLKIYPNSGGTINGLGTNVPITIASGGTSVLLVTANDLAWWTA